MTKSRFGWALLAAVCACGGGSGGGGAGTLELAALPQKIGGAGATLAATLRPAGGAQPPLTIELVSGSTVVATLARKTVGIADARYEGTYLPSAGIDAAVEFAARAQLTNGVVQSAPQTVRVDTVAPLVTSVTAACSVAHGDGKCRRDEALVITARIQAAEAFTPSVTVHAGSSGAPVTLQRAGDAWTATVPLDDFAFPQLEGEVVVRAAARDEVANEGAKEARVLVTRLLWDYVSGGTRTTEVASGLFGPHFDSTIAFGVAGDTKQLRLVRIPCDPTAEPQPTPSCVGSIEVGGDVVQPPATSAFWWVVAGNIVRGLNIDGTFLNGAGCAMSAPAAGPLALADRVPETAIANTSGNWVYASDRESLCDPSPVAEHAFLAAPVTARSGAMYSLTRATGGATVVRAFTFIGGALAQTWAARIDVSTEASPILDRTGRILVSAADGKLYRVTDTGTSGTVESFPTGLTGSPTVAPIVLRDDSIVIPVGQKLARLTSAGAAAWTAVDLGATITGVAALNPGAPTMIPVTGAVTGDALVVTTATGKLVVLRADGAEAWSAQLSSVALSAPGFDFVFSSKRLYVGGSDGHVRALVLDRPLDTGAPWPKAQRDAGNTSRVP